MAKGLKIYDNYVQDDDEKNYVYDHDDYVYDYDDYCVFDEEKN